MLGYVWICMAPLILLFIAKWHMTGSGRYSEITWKEFGISSIAIMIVTAMVYFAGAYSSMYDVAIINGEVTSKKRDVVHCRHSYPCRCRTVRSGKTTSTHCDTCYRHPFDVDWDVHSNVGSERINTVDSQGLIEPPRWTSIKIGEPFATTEQYLNYIKAAPESLLNYGRDKLLYSDIIPQYPDNIYDYYRINRVVQIGVSSPYATKYNEKISEVLKVLGPQKQANLVFVFTSDTPFVPSKT